MGLDTSHDAWHGAYSAFGRWRAEIAKAAGYYVWKVKFDQGGEYDTVMIDWGHLPENALMGEWPETPPDPLLVLIAHSDCDGAINPAQAGPLAGRLEELLPGGGHIGAFGDKTRTFIKGLRAAVAANEPVDFH